MAQSVGHLSPFALLSHASFCPEDKRALCVVQSPRLCAFALKSEKHETQRRQDAEKIFMLSG